MERAAFGAAHFMSDGTGVSSNRTVPERRSNTVMSGSKGVA